ncbi:unnamed protein product [Paramecium sonneborni]|uniref:Uncharacterized protein n=1 Tax=Paramecium sonneborni TaxID=65129 RepID=A0A8S1MS95_9CILI|nr:unnamed protein product [Paramecium sonneborni]
MKNNFEIDELMAILLLELNQLWQYREKIICCFQQSIAKGGFKRFKELINKNLQQKERCYRIQRD